MQGREGVRGGFDAGVVGASVHPEAVSHGILTELTDGVLEERASRAATAVGGSHGRLDDAAVLIGDGSEGHEGGRDGAAVLGQEEAGRGEGALAQGLGEFDAGLLGERRNAVVECNLAGKSIETVQQLGGECGFGVDKVG